MKKLLKLLIILILKVMPNSNINEALWNNISFSKILGLSLNDEPL